MKMKNVIAAVSMSVLVGVTGNAVAAGKDDFKKWDGKKWDGKLAIITLGSSSAIPMEYALCAYPDEMKVRAQVIDTRGVTYLVLTASPSDLDRILRCASKLP